MWARFQVRRLAEIPMPSRATTNGARLNKEFSIFNSQSHRRVDHRVGSLPIIRSQRPDRIGLAF